MLSVNEQDKKIIYFLSLVKSMELMGCNVFMAERGQTERMLIFINWIIGLTENHLDYGPMVGFS